MISLLPLPGESDFLLGNYGIDHCVLSGICQVDYKGTKPFKIEKLKVSFLAATLVHFSYEYGFETMKRNRIWWQDEVVLLQAVFIDNEWVPETLQPGTCLEIPFEIPLPDPIDGIPPIPPSFKISGVDCNHASYQAELNVSLTVEIQELSHHERSFFSWLRRPTYNSKVYMLHPFIVWDPKMVPKLLLPETKNWRSAPGSYPCEYDFEIYNSVVGPGDDLLFSYRVAVSPDMAREGVRIHCIKFVLKENHQVGEARGFYLRSSNEVLRWQQFEYIDSQRSRWKTPSKESSPERGVVLSELRRSDTKAGLLNQRYGRGGGGGDGLYAEAESTIRIPCLYQSKETTLHPSTPKMNEPDSYLSPIASAEIRHVMRVEVEFVNIKNETSPDRLAFECGLVICCVGKKECSRMVDERPELVPTLDYEKVAGTDVWIPPYEQTQVDPLITYDEYLNLKDELSEGDLSDE